MTYEEIAKQATDDLRRALDIANEQGEQAKKLLRITSVAHEGLMTIVAGKGTVDAQLIAQETLIRIADEWKK